MISLIIGILVSLVVTIVGTPLLIRLVHKLNYGQYIRQDGPQSHLVKRGTPTLGGVVINLAIVLGWGASALYRFLHQNEMPSWSAVLVLFAMLSMGMLGFIDDFAKVSKKQSEGLTVRGKFIGQFILATVYAVLALILPTKSGFPSAQAGVSFIESPFFSFEFAGRVVAIVLFVIWVNFLMTAWTNAVNLTDGLDGLAAGSSMIAFVGYAVVAFWEFYHLKGSGHEGFTYAVSDPLDLTIIASCAAVACPGFLWYNSNPASIFMGDTGSLALGGLFAAIGYTILLLQVFRARRKKRLLENGRRVYAQLGEIYQDTSVAVNGRYLWRVSCQYMDERGTMHIFRSDGLNFDPSGLLTGLQIPVYLEEGRPDHYAVDLDAVLPRIEIH